MYMSLGSLEVIFHRFFAYVKKNWSWYVKVIYVWNKLGLRAYVYIKFIGCAFVRRIQCIFLFVHQSCRKKNYARKKLYGPKPKMLLSWITCSYFYQFQSVLYALDGFFKDASNACIPLCISLVGIKICKREACRA